MNEIAKLLGCNKVIIRNWLIKFRIRIRTKSESAKIRSNTIESKKSMKIIYDKRSYGKLYTNKEFLYICYIVCEMSTVEIGNLIGCSWVTVLNWLHKFNISVRTFKEASKMILNLPEIKERHRKATIIAMNKPDTREKNSKSTIEQWEKSGYREKMREIHNTIEYKEKRSKIAIEIWERPEYRKKCSGKNHHAWIEDRDLRYAPYTEDFYDSEFRNKIEEFQNCRDLLDGELLEEGAHLHHFNGNKQDDSHFVKGDSYCNLGFLNPGNHSRHNKGIQFEKLKNKLILHTQNLKDDKIPEFWNKKNKLLFKQENLEQLKLNKFIV